MAVKRTGSSIPGILWALFIILPLRPDSRSYPILTSLPGRAQPLDVVVVVEK